MRASHTAAVVLLLLAPCAQAIELGTLFTAPEERARLDRLRRGEVDATPNGEPVRSANPTLTGFVKRSDGRNTVWIDGVPMPVSRPGSGPLLDPRAVGRTPGDDALKIESKVPR